MDQNKKEKTEKQEESDKKAEAAKKLQFCTKPFDAETSRTSDDDEPCDNSEA